MNAYRDGDITVVSIPEKFTSAQEDEWVTRMLEKLEQKESKRRPTNALLMERALELNTKYLEGKALPMAVKWSNNQGRRWGSCTMPDRTIRISSRVKGLPGWVLDYVLLHELAHILIQDHGPEFWKLLEAFPKTERARGFLEGITFSGENQHS